MKRLLVIAGFLALCVYPAKASFYSFTDTGGNGTYHAGNVEVPTEALICAQWAAALGDGSISQRTVTYSYGPEGNVILDTLNVGDQYWSQSGSLSAGTYSYFQLVSGISGYSNLMILW